MWSKVLIASVAPIAGSALYLVWLHHSLTRKVESKTSRILHVTSTSLPKDVIENSSDYIVMHEETSKAVSTASLLRYESPEELLTTYVRHTMVAFSGYPPAWIFRFLIKSPSDRVSLYPKYIEKLDFKEGDLVNGVYRVSKRTSNSVELIGDPPASYRGPAVDVMIVSGIEARGDQTVFSNDVFMWRTKSEKPVPIESAVGRFMHTIIATSLVEHGTKKLIQSV
jgi:hypothetical protein